MAAEGKNFIRLTNADDSFQQRSNFVFGNLEALEPTADHSRRERSEKGHPDQQRKPPRNQRNRRLPAKVPQHVLSPDKWTKYSLDVDGSERFRGMNEHSLNKHAAYSFLDDLRKRKAGELGLENEKVTENQESETKIAFRKPSVLKKSTSASEESTKGAWKDGTFVMPEYIAGVSGSKKRAGSVRRSGGSLSAGCAKVSLGHLSCDGEEEEAVLSEDCVKQKQGERVFKKRKLDEEETMDNNNEDFERKEDEKKQEEDKHEKATD